MTTTPCTTEGYAAAVLRAKILTERESRDGKEAHSIIECMKARRVSRLAVFGNPKTCPVARLLKKQGFAVVKLKTKWERTYIVCAKNTTGASKQVFDSLYRSIMFYYVHRLLSDYFHFHTLQSPVVPRQAGHCCRLLPDRPS